MQCIELQLILSPNKQMDVNWQKLSLKLSDYHSISKNQWLLV